MNVHLDADDPKRALRRRLQALRHALTPAFRRRAEVGFDQALAHLAQSHPTGAVLAYLPSAVEPPLRPALERLTSTRDVWLPVTGPQRRLTWVRWQSQTQFAPSGPGGLLQPTGPAHPAPRDIGMILVPCLALDDDGLRLGMGGGFYDTFLATVDAEIPRAGCVFAREILPAGKVPADPWDVRLPMALTERGLRRLPGFQAGCPAPPSGIE
ncbi:5-formyltetrahydrofolate cyclo-ligase [Kocuria sp.]|uniref:5-formyltetrahydrofolate cyclo-ligase n=1 Tax=Kocuria sp. TaxID=1871328 RepID=UPI0026E09E8F|nr:5-formyltetrahydrofolate cyclo-ligase [Kocuria sp.]MDO5617312.1 5-formyltetrahydrofolate cyclo-ligase [Kocuria sp.]